MAQNIYDLVVVGGGPAGYTGAIRASQLGLRVAVVELEPRLGGTCLRVGCIPSKALLESSDKFAATREVLAQHGVQVGQVRLDLATMMQRKDAVVSGLTQGIAGLFKKHKIDRLEGRASLLAATADGIPRLQVQGAAGTLEVLGRRLLLATGSREAQLPGVKLDGDRIGTSTEALQYTEVPEHLVVIGAGAIGLELGCVWARLGAKVTVLEYADRILPSMDVELAQAAQRIFSKQGLSFRLGTKVLGAKRVKAGCEVRLDGGEAIACDRVLLAVGRVPNTEGLGLEAVGLSLDPRGRIPVDAHFATALPGVYAVGDVIAGPMLAHKAEEEAVACVEQLATGYGHVNYDAIPYVVYTDPEVASIGATEEELKQRQVAYRKGSFPLMANARARAMGQAHGFVKLLADAKTDRIIGAHLIAPHGSELIAELGACISLGASSEDVARICHAHPTLAESIKEAALAVDGRSLNM